MTEFQGQAEDTPGFTDALLDVLEVEQDNGVRLSSMWARTNRLDC